MHEDGKIGDILKGKIFLCFCLHRLSLLVMKKIYYLTTCSTCEGIMKELRIDQHNGFELQDIRTKRITPEQIDEMQKLAGSYEALFSRRALKYKELGLKDKKLTEEDYKNYLLEHDTFLKRPVVIIGDNRSKERRVGKECVRTCK